MRQKSREAHQVGKADAFRRRLFADPPHRDSSRSIGEGVPMRSRKSRGQYEQIVQSKRGHRMGTLQNPVSRLSLGAGGRKYCSVFVVNPMRSNRIDRLFVSEEDLPKLMEMREIVITVSGEVVVRSSHGRKSTMEYFLYGEPPRLLKHLNGDPLDFRRRNICVAKKTKGNDYLPPEKSEGMVGFWDMRFEGATRALVSLCIRDDPEQNWFALVKKVAEIKGCPEEEVERQLTKFEEQGMLGYHVGGEWKEWRRK